MKILAIRIKNLASLEGISEIDFTKDPLCSAGIFAITGATGSGKSTILDAICLALYGKTPRYIHAKETGIDIKDTPSSKISQSDVKGILRDGTSDGFAEVDFMGIDGVVYKASWQVKRAYNKIDGALQAETISLVNLNTNLLISGKKTEALQHIERLVGLSFDQFTRSVLLAQGDFTAFLRANKDDKASLLEKLTGNFIYSEISKLIFEKCKKAEQELREVTVQKEGIVMLSDEEVAEIEYQQQELTDSIKLLEEFSKELIEEQNWHERLTELSTAVTNAELNYNSALNDKSASETRAKFLKQVKDVQPTRTLVESRNQNLIELKEVNNELTAICQNVEQLNNHSTIFKKKLQEAEYTLNAAKKIRADAIPLIEKAKKLDVVIDEKNDQLRTSKKVIDDARIELSVHYAQVEKKQSEVNLLTEQIDKLERWNTENSHRKLIAQNFTLISSKLIDASNFLITKVNANESLQLNLQNQSSLANDIINLESYVIDQKAAIKLKSDSIKDDKQTITGIDIDKLNRDKQTIDAQFEDIFSGAALWNLFYQSSKVQHELLTSLKMNQTSVTAKRDALVMVQARLKEAKIARDTSGKILSDAKLKIAESVEQLRSALNEDEPCSVCGSIEHPYRKHSPILEGVIEGLEKEHRQNEETYESSFEEFTGLTQNCEVLERQIKLEESQLEIKTASTNKLQDKWMSCKVCSQCEKINDEKKADWLHDKTIELRSAQTLLEGKIRRCNDLKKAIEQIQVEIEKSILNLTKSTDEVKDKKHKKELLVEAAKGYSEQLAKCDVNLQLLQDELSPYFQNKEWFEHWQINSTQFVGRIKDFADQWMKNIDELNNNTNKAGIYDAELTGLSNRTNDILISIDKQEQIVITQTKELEINLKERKSLLGGELITVIEKRFEDSVVKGDIGVKTITIQLQESETLLIKANTLKAQLTKSEERLSKQISTNTSKINEWLSAYSDRYGVQLKEEELTNLLKHSSDWIEGEQQAMETIDNALTIASSVFAERKNQIKEHTNKKLQARTEEQVKELISVNKLNLEQSVQIKSQNSFKLKHDISNKQRASELLKKVIYKEQILENWSRLNDVIGSSDGKKFRQIAQEFTLDVLLEFANIHMQILSKRYSIERISNTLGLQVIDQEMGNEVRTIYSLSGGESFLVSLALALGLAELSSNKMNVESLFIDEGFGSLDPLTLTIAMGALEGLHNQGRKVGVISHVQEMTERIPTQIKVHKISSGKSKLEVIGI